MTNIRQNTEINGAIITDDCVDQLKTFQADDNNYLREQAMLIADAALYIAKTLMGRSPSEKDNERAQIIVSDLAFLKDDLLKFKKP